MIEVFLSRGDEHHFEFFQDFMDACFFAEDYVMNGYDVCLSYLPDGSEEEGSTGNQPKR